MPQPRRPLRWSGSPALRILRRPVAWWTLVALLAIGSAWFVSTLTAEARRTIRTYGDTRPVLVATADIEPGDRVGEHNTEVQQRPTGLIPEDAVAEIGRTARAAGAIYAGEMVPAGRLGGSLPPAMAGVTLPLGLTAPVLDVGGFVDVVVTFDPLIANGSGTGSVIARAAPVVDVSDDQVTIAVDRGELVDVAKALSLGTVTIASVSGTS